MGRALLTIILVMTTTITGAVFERFVCYGIMLAVITNQKTVVFSFNVTV